MKSKKTSLGWGRMDKSDMEIWDTDPVFLDDTVGRREWLKLLFYPKKWFLYRYIKRAFDREMADRSMSEPFCVLDVGCGMGATVIDFKKMFGRRADVVGVDVVKLQTELAREKAMKNAVKVEFDWYEGNQLPFSKDSFDAVYSADVLGHVKDVANFLNEINRVLKPGGALALFSESKLGRHALIRKYLLKRGLNVDPHADVHISLHSKLELQKLMRQTGFDIEKIRGVFWASFWVHPDEFYPKLNQAKGFFFLRLINKLLYKTKRLLHPYSTAACELYGLLEACMIGRWVEAQGYIILAKKKNTFSNPK